MSAPAFPHLPAEAWTLWLADELEGAGRARVEDHVASCADCRRIVLLHDPARAAFLLREAPAPSWDGFWDELQPQLGPPAAARSRRRHGLIALGAAASLVVAVFAGRSLMTPGPASGSLTAVAADPCAAPALANLRMTKAECEALYSGPIGGETAETEVVVVRDLDLRGL